MNNKYCMGCGSPLNEDSHFCHKCGRQVGIDETSLNPETIASRTYKSKKRSNKVVLMICGIVLAVIILAVIVWLMMSMTKNKKSIDDSTVLDLIQDRVLSSMDFEITSYEVLDHKTDKQNNSDELVCRITAENEVLKYEAQYNMEFEYSKEKKEWDLVKCNPDKHERRLIPLKYDYDGFWMDINNLEGGSFYINMRVNWKDATLTDSFGEKSMVFYDDVVNGHYTYGMMVEGDGLKFEFNYSAIEDAQSFSNVDLPSYIFNVYHNDVLYNKFDERFLTYGSGCLTLRAKDGTVIVDEEDLMSVGGAMAPPDCSLFCSIQLDFDYNIEYKFKPYINEIVDVYFCDQKIGEATIDDIEPFYTLMVVNSEYISSLAKCDEIRNTLVIIDNMYYDSMEK